MFDEFKDESETRNRAVVGEASQVKGVVFLSLYCKKERRVWGEVKKDNKGWDQRKWDSWMKKGKINKHIYRKKGRGSRRRLRPYKKLSAVVGWKSQKVRLLGKEGSSWGTILKQTAWWLETQQQMRERKNKNSSLWRSDYINTSIDYWENCIRVRGWKKSSSWKWNSLKMNIIKIRELNMYQAICVIKENFKWF